MNEAELRETARRLLAGKPAPEEPKRGLPSLVIPQSGLHATASSRVVVELIDAANRKRARKMEKRRAQP